MNTASQDLPALDDGFALKVDSWVLQGLDPSLQSFDELLQRLPGVYPTDAMAALQRLLKAGKISLAHHRRLFQAQPLPLPTERYQLHLPVPHPLDFDWRFTDSTIDMLLGSCLECSQPGDSLLLLGVPSVFGAAVDLAVCRRAILLDASRPTVLRLSQHCSDPQGPYRALHCDLASDPLPSESAKAVVVDPPWYPEHLRVFLWAAASLAEPDGQVLLSLPPLGTRPGIDGQRQELIATAINYGLRPLEIHSGAITYTTPPFERNSLAAIGLPAVSSRWRKGDLLLLRRDRPNRQPRPALQRQTPCWDEVPVFGVRIKVRRGSVEFADPSLVSIVAGDVLTSVSRRDPRRASVDVWTSGNRVFSCAGPFILKTILQAMVDGKSVAAAILQTLQRCLTDSEHEQISFAMRQLRALLSRELQDAPGNSRIDNPTIAT